MGVIGTIVAIILAILISFVGSLIVGLAEVAKYGGILGGIILTAYLIVTFIKGAMGKDE